MQFLGALPLQASAMDSEIGDLRIDGLLALDVLTSLIGQIWCMTIGYGYDSLCDSSSFTMLQGIKEAPKNNI